MIVRMLSRVDPPSSAAAFEALGDGLRMCGYSDRRVAQSLGIIAWNGPDLDSHYWARPCCADGPAGDRVELLVRGRTLPIDRARAALPPAAWESGAVAPDGRATGMILPLGDELVWTDRADRAFVGDDGLFLPDSTTLAVRRALPPAPVDRHLDLGSGGGAVAVRAAATARETLALDLNPRAAEGCHRTAALSRARGISAWTGVAADARELGMFDRVSFVLPLLVPWVAQASAPVHTVARSSGLLAEVLRLLPDLLAPGGLAILYTQSLDLGRIAAAFGARRWRGAYAWDYAGESILGPMRAGILAIRADAPAGWVEVERSITGPGEEDGWAVIGPLLGE